MATTFNEMFDQIPVGGTVAEHWAHACPAQLDAAAQTIEVYGASPWVFVADERHFRQFAGDAEYDALTRMTRPQFEALCYWLGEQA